MRITREAIQQTKALMTISGDKTINEYRLASRLRDLGYFFTMPELRKLLGMGADDIDPEIRRGINGTLERMGQ
jgi:hypothetical protein